jgi:hypothetical protein
MTDGDAVKLYTGESDGLSDGSDDGSFVGKDSISSVVSDEGSNVGYTSINEGNHKLFVGLIVGELGDAGTFDGVSDGCNHISSVGADVSRVGSAVGSNNVSSVGSSVGFKDGSTVE